METTLVLIKPDAVERKLAGEIISRFERKGFAITALRMLQITPELARQHYKEHATKSFYPQLEAFITSGQTIALKIAGEGVIKSVRLMVGPTNGLEASSGTIRGDYATSTQRNLIHASDSAESASREIAIFFGT